MVTVTNLSWRKGEKELGELSEYPRLIYSSLLVISIDPENQADGPNGLAIARKRYHLLNLGRINGRMAIEFFLPSNSHIHSVLLWNMGQFIQTLDQVNHAEC